MRASRIEIISTPARPTRAIEALRACPAKVGTFLYPDTRQNKNKLTISKSRLGLGGRDSGLTAEKPLPERALNFGGEFRPFVGQKLDGAGLILNQF